MDNSGLHNPIRVEAVYENNTLHIAFHCIIAYYAPSTIKVMGEIVEYALPSWIDHLSGFIREIQQQMYWEDRHLHPFTSYHKAAITIITLPAIKAIRWVFNPLIFFSCAATNSFFKSICFIWVATTLSLLAT